MNYQPPEDSAEPSPMRARVPDHVAGGSFSTGVIVMTAQSEFILDFVQNLGRPHSIVARLVMPHSVLPQLVDALQRNVDLYRSRWGELPLPVPLAPPPPGPDAEAATGSGVVDAGAQTPLPATDPAAHGGWTDIVSEDQAKPPPAEPDPAARQASAQEVYDDLKIKDELLSGAYANAVMIGHGPHEFSFDFITNFYPNSAVSARVFLAAGQIPRLLDSLKGTWDKLRQRMQPPPDQPPG